MTKAIRVHLRSSAVKNSSAVQHGFQLCQYTFILRARAHGDAQPFRQAIRIERAHDHAAPLQRLEYPRAIADFHQDKIRHARHEFQPQRPESRLKLAQPGAIFFRAFLGELAVIQRGERRRLPDGVDIERLPHPVEQGDELRAAVAITHAQRRQSREFLKTSAGKSRCAPRG